MIVHIFFVHIILNFHVFMGFMDFIKLTIYVKALDYRKITEELVACSDYISGAGCLWYNELMSEKVPVSARFLSHMLCRRDGSDKIPYCSSSQHSKAPLALLFPNLIHPFLVWKGRVTEKRQRAI